MALLDNLKSTRVSKVHQALTNETKAGWIKCIKPSGDTYGLIIDQFIKRIDDGEIIVDKEDEEKGIIFFTYKGSGSPF